MKTCTMNKTKIENKTELGEIDKLYNKTYWLHYLKIAEQVQVNLYGTRNIVTMWDAAIYKLYEKIL